MLTCPICNTPFNTDETTLSLHVNSHFDGGVDPLAGSAAESSSQVVNGSAIGTGRGGRDAVDGDEAEDHDCMICGQDLGGLAPRGREAHVNACLDGSSHSPDLDNDAHYAQALLEEELAFQERYDPDGMSNTLANNGNGNGNGNKKYGKGFSLAGGRGWKEGDGREKGDEWWSPVDSSLDTLPKTFTPGLIPLLSQVLHASSAQGVTKKAVLCSEGVCHVKGAWGFDLGWGCGYRNLEMALTALLSSNASYRPLFPSSPDSAAPGVRRLQVWMREGWEKGFDWQGKEQLKGDIVGTKKWIGTSDLWMVMSSKGIPCNLYDFPKPTGGKWNSASSTHTALIKFIREYFDADAPAPSISSEQSGSKSAFDVMMNSSANGKGGNSVRVSEKLPLILQHAGHSRTIVGYEVNAQGNVNVLMFDPGRSIPSDIRAAATSQYRSQRDSESSSNPSAGPSNTFPPSGSSSASSLSATAPTESRINKESRAFASDSDSEPEDAPQKNDTSRPQDLRSDEEMTKGGWVRKKVDKTRRGLRRGGSGGGNGEGGKEWGKKPVEVLKVFRVNLGTLSRNTEYQVLAFTGGPVLTEGERNSRKVVRAEAIWN